MPMESLSQKLRDMEPGLWAKRLIVACLMVYLGWMTFTKEITGQDLKEIVLVVVTYYFAQPKDQG